MKRIRFLLTSIAFSLTLMSCGTTISVQAAKTGGADFSFKTGFSEITAKTLRTISGLPENSPIFSPDDIKEILTQAGIQKTKVRTPSSMQIESSGFVANAASAISKTNLFKQTSNSLSVTLGPKQIQEIYSHLGDESQSYFDMMMIPPLIGETMSKEDYRMLLASMYGPTFANELVDGKITIRLSSPDGRKTTNAESTLGEILTMTQEKTWKVIW